MFNLKVDKDKKVHFVGIGGVSMSGLAEILLDHGYTVSGSDRSESDLTHKLKRSGAKIYIGHSAGNVHNQNLVVYTAAIAEDNPELQRARDLKIPTIDRAEFLGDIMKAFSKSIAVSGTHGKTTATSMLSHILVNAKLDPTITVGGDIKLLNGNVRTGKSEYFLAESCEYKGSFLKLCPKVGIILNIDADHLDYYKDIDEIENTFKAFSDLIPENGMLIGWAEDPRVIRVLQSHHGNVLTYGIHTGDFTVQNIEYNAMGYARFDVYFKGISCGRIELSVPGEHNILNALAAICASNHLGIDFKCTARSLKEFEGTKRRFEKKGTRDGIVVIDDYAHHPTEIIATLKAAKNHPHKKIFCVFQPHTYTRTLNLFSEFACAFGDTDELLLLDIYAAREKDMGIINSAMLCDAITRNKVKAQYSPSFDATVAYLSANASAEDLILTMGAGDVYRVGELFLEQA